ncbi:class I SAM-dependent methyltransferase [Methylococcus capsulatus]|uniref:Class I SAM-dependent methyltransferase n=2 Tax=Methylococcaceae TaxID=403 RepID=A0ABZ2F2J2_METCP|nr:class I SAM-dependent methyltransferase [Methylococcus capsulatus]
MMLKQTKAHDKHNADLLAILPLNAERIIEVGCSTGALAREYKKLNPKCNYIGIDIDPDYAKLAERYCDSTLAIDIERIPEDIFISLFPSDCWIFGDTLEHFHDPWSVLTRIRKMISQSGCISACIPNAQHWSVQARLNSGNFVYEEVGLLDKTHLRWFTRTTMLNLFNDCGFRVEVIIPRIFYEPGRDKVMSAVRAMAISIGSDPERAAIDAMPIQYVIRAAPI